MTLDVQAVAAYGRWQAHLWPQSLTWTVRGADHDSMDERQQNDPVIETWLRSSPFGEQCLRLSDGQPLTALTLLVASPGRQHWRDLPESVLGRWHHLLAARRRELDQSELAFIDQSRRQGVRWVEIAEALGQPDAAAAEQRRAALLVRLEQMHPAEAPKPWITTCASHTDC